MDIEKRIKTLIARAIKESAISKRLKEIPELKLDCPRDKRFGELSTNIAMLLARQMNASPVEIAQQIQTVLNKILQSSDLFPAIEKIEVKGAGFINFFLSKVCLHEVLLEIKRKGSNFGRLKVGKAEKVHIEFVSANPTGPLNVAHGRQAAFGDTLANILSFAGYKVSREYYLNDEGVQIDTLGESLRAKYLGLLGIDVQFPDAGYRGKYIDELAEELVQKYGPKFVKNWQKKLSFFSQFAYLEILKKIKEDLSAFGVRFDCWLSQKQLNKSGKIDQALTFLKKKGFLYKKEGAWWLASTRFGDDKDRVVIKSNSNLTYIAPDIAYHQTKFRRRFTRLINVWGPDHHGYILRLKAAISALGYEAKNLKVLIVQLVSLVEADKVIPMSTRAGQYVSLDDITRAVGKDAARFFFLMRNRDSHLRFDLELAKKQSLENPVYYIQYAHARLLNILKFAKTNSEKLKLQKKEDLSLLNKAEELNLIQILRKFPSIIESCAQALEPHRVTTYLQDLAKSLHHYYEKHRVVTEDLRLTCARLVLIDAVRIVLDNGLRLLTISAPEKM
ncbi:MAG: arginine--tRNA ligase [Omnitrophica bacterium]|nr:arginine--tRNA ligase [Candidatus Omnitrophota bacterium]